MKNRYFKDLYEGKKLECQSILMARESILEFGKKFDPQPFHTDERAAKNSIFKGLIASSLHTLSECTRVVVQAQKGITILSGVGMHEVLMFNPVRPGDQLFVDAWWADLKKSGSKPDRGFASIMCKVRNQNYEPIIEYGYRYLLACKHLR